MAISSTGATIVALCKNYNIQAGSTPELTQYDMQYHLSEPTNDGSTFDGRLVGEVSVESSIQPTDSEIEATLRVLCAVRLSQEFFPSVFNEVDIRGCKL